MKDELQDWYEQADRGTRGDMVYDILADWKEDRVKHESAAASLRVALDKSVRLQSHYAELLNMWDGGKRMTFKNSDAWLDRLREMKLKHPTQAANHD